jgi:peroxiredoxin
MKQIIAVFIFLGLSLILTPKLYSTEQALNPGIIKPRVRVEAPAFTLEDLDGNELKLSDIKDKVVLLNFWATWCAPCVKEMDDMERLWQKLGKKGFMIIAVSEDRGSPKAVRRFTKAHSITFPVLLDPDGTARRAYEVTGLPTSYIIERDGRISGKIIGERDWDGVWAIEYFENLLKKETK